MTNYRIETNPQYDSKEIYFDGKPSEAVRTALKGLRFRWNSTKKCWYGFAEQLAIIAAITGNETENGGTVSEGYMGAARWDGNKSHLHLYGSELSAAIRAEIKAAGIKGVTVSCKTYSGGQSLHIKCKFTEADMVGVDEFINNYSIYDICGYWIRYEGKDYPREQFFKMCNNDPEIRANIARHDYEHYAKHGFETNGCSIKYYTAFKPEFLAKLHKICEILATYNYDDSNSMVDYYNTNFYQTIEAVAA